MASMAEAVERLSEAIERGSLLLERHEARELRQRLEESHERTLTDALRRPPKEPRRLDLPLMATATPGLLGQFAKQVPGEFWTQTDYQQATVACPCQTDTVVPLGVPTSCACDRFFLYTGRELRVARYPAEEPAERA